MLVIAAVSATLHRTKLAELLLPVAEHMRLHQTKFADFTDGEIALCRDRRQFS